MSSHTNFEDAYEAVQEFAKKTSVKQRELGKRFRLRLTVHQFKKLFKHRELQDLWRHSSRIEPWLQGQLLSVATPDELEEPLFQSIAARFPNESLGQLAVDAGLVTPKNVRGLLKVHQWNVADLKDLRPWTQFQYPMALIGLILSAGIGSSLGWGIPILSLVAVLATTSLFWFLVFSKPESELKLVGEILNYAALVCDPPTEITD